MILRRGSVEECGRGSSDVPKVPSSVGLTCDPFARIFLCETLIALSNDIPCAALKNHHDPAVKLGEHNEQR